MKIECMKCNTVKDLTGEELKTTIHTILRRNPNAKASTFLKALSGMDEPCTDGDDHMYVYHKDFILEVEDKVKTYKDNKDQYTKDREEMMRRAGENVELNNKIKENDDIIRRLEGELELRTENCNSSVKGLEEISGTTDVNIWS